MLFGEELHVAGGGGDDDGKQGDLLPKSLQRMCFFRGQLAKDSRGQLAKLCFRGVFDSQNTSKNLT